MQFIKRIRTTTILLLILKITFSINNAVLEEVNGIYFLHIHKSGGTQLCRIATEMGYRIAGDRNCGPTIEEVQGDEKLHHVLTTIIPRILISDPSGINLDDYIIKCEKKRVAPDRCNVWNAKSNIRALRTWFKGKVGSKQRNVYEVEIPVWDYDQQDGQQEKIMSNLNINFIANERYVSPWMKYHMIEKRTNPSALLTEKFCFVVMLRNPITRAFSHWKFDKKVTINIPPRTSFETYMKKYMRDNFMTRTLCGLECMEVDHLTQSHYDTALQNLFMMDAVLLMEEYETSLSLMHHLCPDYNQNGFSWENFTNRISGFVSSTIPEIELRDRPELLAKLISLHQWDIKLYRKAQQIFADQFEESEIDGPFPTLQNPLETVNVPIDQFIDHSRPMLVVGDHIVKDSQSNNHRNGEDSNLQSIIPHPNELHLNFLTHFDRLIPLTANMVSAVHHNVMRLQFPSVFMDQNGTYHVILNVQNDYICEGYVIIGNVDPTNNFTSLTSIHVNPRNNYLSGSRLSSSGISSSSSPSISQPFGEYKFYNDTLSVLFFNFQRESMFTGAENGRAITSPDGKHTYLVFNCKNENNLRRIAVIDYNVDPGHAVFLGIQSRILQQTEKNWSPFFMPEDNTLYFVYSFNPTIILRCYGLKEAVRQKQNSLLCKEYYPGENIRWPSIGANMIIRGGSALIPYNNGPYYVGLVHSHVRVAPIGIRDATWNRACYRTLLIVMDMRTFDIVHLSYPLQFGPEFVRPLGRTDARDTYNQYGSGLYKYNDGNQIRWIVGINFENHLAVLGEIENMDDYFRTHKYMFKSMGTIQRDSVHIIAREMEETHLCSAKRMTERPPWAQLQQECDAHIHEKMSIIFPWTK